MAFSFAVNGSYTDCMLDKVYKGGIDNNAREIGLKRKLDIYTDNMIKSNKITIEQG